MFCQLLLVKRLLNPEPNKVNLFSKEWSHLESHQLFALKVWLYFRLTSLCFNIHDTKKVVCLQMTTNCLIDFCWLNWKSRPCYSIVYHVAFHAAVILAGKSSANRFHRGVNNIKWSIQRSSQCSTDLQYSDLFDLVSYLWTIIEHCEMITKPLDLLVLKNLHMCFTYRQKACSASMLHW